MAIQRENKTAEMLAEEMEEKARELIHTAALLRGHVSAEVRIIPKKTSDTYPRRSKEKQ